MASYNEGPRDKWLISSALKWFINLWLLEMEREGGTSE